MLPTLKIPKEPLLSNGFINAFICDRDKEESYDGCIYVLFYPENIDKFREFLDSEYDRTVSVIEDYDHDGGYVVVVYKLNEDFIDDFYLVKKGKYSKTSFEFQEQFPKTVIVQSGSKRTEVISLQIRVFQRHDDLINYWEEKLSIPFSDNMEVWEGFHKEREILDIIKVKEILNKKQES